MAAHVKIEAQPRVILGKKVRQLRRQGILPGRIFGHGDPVPVQIDMSHFLRLRETHQTTGVIDLALNGQTHTVLVRHIEHEPRTGKMQHIDFFRVQMNEKLHARVPLLLSGTSTAARNIGGTVIPLVETVQIECLPDDLPDSVALDISKLTATDMVLHASDLDLPKAVTLLDNPDEPVAKIQPPRGAEPVPEAIQQQEPPLEEQI